MMTLENHNELLGFIPSTIESNTNWNFIKKKLFCCEALYSVQYSNVLESQVY